MSNEQNQIFIGNLPFSLSENDLENIFAEFGEISQVKIPVNRENGRKRGFAFVTFASSESAQKALSKNDYEVDGRKIRVNMATRKPNEGGRGRF